MVKAYKVVWVEHASKRAWSAMKGRRGAHAFSHPIRYFKNGKTVSGPNDTTLYAYDSKENAVGNTIAEFGGDVRHGILHPSRYAVWPHLREKGHLEVWECECEQTTPPVPDYVAASLYPVGTIFCKSIKLIKKVKLERNGNDR